LHKISKRIGTTQYMYVTPDRCFHFKLIKSIDRQLQLNLYQFYFCLPEISALVNSRHRAITNTHRKVIKYSSLKVRYYR